MATPHPDSINPTVVFGPRMALSERLPNDQVLMAPLSDEWNDFGFRTRVDVRVHLAERSEPFSTSAFIGFITENEKAPNGIRPLVNQIKNAGGNLVEASSSLPFFTMLPDMQAYRDIVQALGAHRAQAVLAAMRDVVAAQDTTPKPKWLGAAVRTEVFSRSFMRNSESYFAYKNAAAILRGLAQEEFRNVSRDVSITFQLDGRPNPHALSFRFDHKAHLPKRIAVVIGENGVGKSQTLGRIAKAAINGESSLVDGETNQRVLLNRLLAFAPTNEAGSVFPTDRRKRSRIWYRRFALNRTQSGRKSEVADLVLQVARSTESIGTNSRWELLISALKGIERWEEICLPTVNNIAAPVVLATLLRGSEQMLLDRFNSIDVDAEPVRVIGSKRFKLSSGEMSFLRFAAQASAHVENGTLLLLDEPETHLHPSFISQFVALLDQLLERTGSAAIIATHSVYFVREVFQDQVIVLRKDENGFVIPETPALRTFGADVGAISYFVFGEDTASRLATTVEKRLRRRYESWDTLFDAYKDKLSLEMLGDLRASMEGSEEP